MTVRNDCETWYIPSLGKTFTKAERDDAFTKMKVATPTLNGGRWITTRNGARVFIRNGFISVGVRSEPKASSKGANRIMVKDFKAGAKDKWDIARQHVSKHVVNRKEYPDEEMYLGRALELAEKPVGGNIAGYARKDGKTIVRYDKETNEYVVAVVGSFGGIITLFHPKDGELYYINNMQDDLGEQKEIRRRANMRRNQK